MSVTTPKIVQPSGRGHYLWFVLGLVMIVALGLAYSQVPYWVKTDVVSTVSNQNEAAALELKDVYIEQLEEERDALRLQVAALERSSQVDRQAIEQVREEMKQAAADRLQLEEELVFLKGLVTNGTKKEGLFMQGFKLEKGAAEREFRYRFTVGQRLKDVGTVTGWISMTLEGKTGDQATSLSLTELVADKADRIKMRFKHFQNVEGTVVLPEGFEPKDVIIEVQPSNSDLSLVKKSFDWLVAHQ